MYNRMEALFYILILLVVPMDVMYLPWSTLADNTMEAGGSCFRIRTQIMIENEESDLGYISTMYREIEMQKKNGEIRNSTANLILESLSRMSHGWCKPELTEEEHGRQERSLALAIAALISLGTLILGPAIAALLHEITENTKWRKVEQINGIKTIKWMEDMEKRLIASEKVEEILASIMLHESIMADLLQHTDKSSLNRTWRKVFKILIETYTRNGFSTAAPEDIKVADNENLLPNEVYHYTVTVHTNDNCKNAKIKIKAVGIIPSSECFIPHEDNHITSVNGYIKLKTDNKNTCIYTGNNTVKLADNSIFSLSNSMHGPCQNNLLDFKTHKNTLLMHPNHDRAYMKIRCEGNKEVKSVIFKDELVVPPARCTTWVMGNKRKKPDMDDDFTGVNEEYINSEDGSKIEGNINMTRESIIFLPFTALSDLERKEEDYMSLFESVLNDGNENQQQGSQLINLAIGGACALALAVICLMWYKMRERRQPVAHIAIWHAQGEQQNERTTLKEEDYAEIRKLLGRRHSESEEECGSHRRRSSDDCQIEKKHKVEKKNKEQQEQGRRSSKELHSGGHQHKEEDKNREENAGDGEVADDSEAHYDVTRILYDGHMYEYVEYCDDTVLMETESKKITSNRNSMEKEKMETKKEEGEENSKEVLKIETNYNGNQLKTEEAEDEGNIYIYMGNGKKGKRGLKEQDLEEDEGLDEEDLLEADGLKEEYMLKDKGSKELLEGEGFEKEDLVEDEGLEEENLLDDESANEPTENHGAEEKSRQSEDLKRDKTKERKPNEEIHNNNRSIFQGSLHEQMLKELRERFATLKHIHNL